MSTSPYLAPSTSIAFSGALTSRPSMENVTIFVCGLGIRRSGTLAQVRRRHADRFEHVVGTGVVAARELGGGAGLHLRALHVLLELLAEVLDHRGDRHRHRVPEH